MDTETQVAQTQYAHIVHTPGTMGGEARIAGHRIRVRDVVVARDLEGLLPEEIAASVYPSLTLAEVVFGTGLLRGSPRRDRPCRRGRGAIRRGVSPAEPRIGPRRSAGEGVVGVESLCGRTRLVGYRPSPAAAWHGGGHRSRASGRGNGRCRRVGRGVARQSNRADQRHRLSYSGRADTQATASRSLQSISGRRIAAVWANSCVGLSAKPVAGIMRHSARGFISSRASAFQL